jgi:hypothetical protein
LQNSQAKYDGKFCQLINISLLDDIYKDFFKSSKSVGQSELVEAKNRSFKDLFNMMEDAVVKFYEIFVKCKAQELKNQKLEETFLQLDSVFSHQSPESNDDQRVLEELRNLNQKTLSQYFSLQQEFQELQALDGVSVQILKLLKKSQDKTLTGSHNSK